MAGPRGIDQQPVGQVKWVTRESLKPNDYNPNKVAPPELELLIISIVEDGWTQPIVALNDGTIVDGFHRYTVSEDPRILRMTGGMVPVVFIEADPYHVKMSTVRHNRARGTHAVVPMAKIVSEMINDGLPMKELKERLGMEREEIVRLCDKSGMPKRASKGMEGFNQSWKPSRGQE
jgi:ParB-like chromosome segregation protein Spo0J